MKLEGTGADGSKYCYTENFWTGKRTIIVNSTELEKQNKRTFLMTAEDGTVKQCSVTGSFLTGVKLVIEGGETVVLAKNTWYDWILIFFPILGIPFSYFFGGWLWATIACLGAAVINATMVRSIKNVVGKIFACIGVGIALNAAWMILAMVISGVFMTLIPGLFE